MLLDAFGFRDAGNQFHPPQEDDIRRNTGIWAPDAGQCDIKETRKPCKLPYGSKFYSWANREKVIPSY